MNPEIMHPLFIMILIAFISAFILVTKLIDAINALLDRLDRIEKADKRRKEKNGNEQA